VEGQLHLAPQHSFRSQHTLSTPFTHHTSLTTAQGPFERVSDEPVFPDINEDPGLFVDTRGNFHILTHDFANPTGGHAYSEDGLIWKFAGQGDLTSSTLHLIVPIACTLSLT
jgi:hypothetical protein